MTESQLMGGGANLLDRLARALAVSPGYLREELERRGSPVMGDCWLGPTQVWHNGRPQETRRVLWELAHGEPLGRNRRLRNSLCPTPRCANPFHYEVQIYQSLKERLGIVEPEFDLMAFYAEEAASLAQDDLEAEDVYDLVTGAEGGSHRTAEDLHAQWPDFSIEQFEQALARVRRERGED